MVTKTNLKAGRKWSVGGSGISDLRRQYIVILDQVTAVDGEMKSFPGVPEIGSAHPGNSRLVVSGYEVAEGASGDKIVLTVDVKYSLATNEVGEVVSDEDPDAEVETVVVEQWGWDSGSDERELIDDVDGLPLVNSAGDAFDRVPTVTSPAPVFTKVMRFSRHQLSALDCDCKVNGGSVTIGGRTFPEGTLRVRVAESIAFEDPKHKYRYTIKLEYRSNPVRIEGSGATTDIGWDVAVTDAGMREIGENGKLRLIKAIDAETGKKCTVTTPELLDGNGKAVDRSGGATPAPYNFRFKAYARASIPTWFYTEPIIEAPKEDEET